MYDLKNVDQDYLICGEIFYTENTRMICMAMMCEHAKAKIFVLCDGNRYSDDTLEVDFGGTAHLGNGQVLINEVEKILEEPIVRTFKDIDDFMKVADL